MDSCRMASAISARNSLAGDSTPRLALVMERRKLVTVTPGMATGYWKARKMPLRAFSSVAISVMSSPLYQTLPAVMV